jgi:hypothetical protein
MSLSEFVPPTLVLFAQWCLNQDKYLQWNENIDCSFIDRNFSFKGSSQNSSIPEHFKDLSPRVAHRNLQKYSWLSKPTDMTIQWKALENHFLMVPLVFRINSFSTQPSAGQGKKNIFWIFLKTWSLKSYCRKEFKFFWHPKIFRWSPSG